MFPPSRELCVYQAIQSYYYIYIHLLPHPLPFFNCFASDSVLLLAKKIYLLPHPYLSLTVLNMIFWVQHYSPNTETPTEETVSTACPVLYIRSYLFMFYSSTDSSNRFTTYEWHWVGILLPSYFQ